MRGPVDEAVELDIDHRTGLKAYIASEDRGINTSAGLIRGLFGRCIYLGRQYGRTKNKADLYEALRLLGTGCHCLEDYSAHSNYVELAMRECGEFDIFPMVGRITTVHVQGVDYPIFPIVTGTFGGVDFLHSVMGEFSDHVTQSEISELEGSVSAAQHQQNPSLLKELLKKLPSGIFGGKDEVAKIDQLQANAHANAMNNQMSNLQVSRDPGAANNDAFLQQLQSLRAQIYPIMECHDSVLQKISTFIEKIPILPSLIDKIQEQINVFAFSLLAPLVLPIINQVKAELMFGSSEVIASSRAKQLNIFMDDRCSDPTHSMLSKDHFSNVLNEPAGKVASEVLRWTVPQVMAAWDDERVDVNRLLNRIVKGVFHHPALREHGEDGARNCRQLMVGIVQTWWRGKSEAERRVLRGQLSRDGVKQGRNHKDGVHDSGHGSCGPPNAPNQCGSLSAISNLTSIPGTSCITPGGGNHGGGSFNLPSQPMAQQHVTHISNLASQSVVGGTIGGMVGGLLGKVGSNLLGKTFGGKIDDGYGYGQQGQNMSGQGYTEMYGQVGYPPVNSGINTGADGTGGHGGAEVYGQAQYPTIPYPSGGNEQLHQNYGQCVQHGQTCQGYEYQERIDMVPGYAVAADAAFGHHGYDDDFQSGEMHGRYSNQGDLHGGDHNEHNHSHSHPHSHNHTHPNPAINHSTANTDTSSNSGSEWDEDKKARKHAKKERKRREKEERKRREEEELRLQGVGGYVLHQGHGVHGGYEQHGGCECGEHEQKYNRPPPPHEYLPPPQPLLSYGDGGYGYGGGNDHGGGEFYATPGGYPPPHPPPHAEDGYGMQQYPPPPPQQGGHNSFYSGLPEHEHQAYGQQSHGQQSYGEYDVGGYPGYSQQHELKYGQHYEQPHGRQHEQGYEQQHEQQYSDQYGSQEVPHGGYSSEGYGAGQGYGQRSSSGYPG